MISGDEGVASARRPTPLDPYPEPRPPKEGGDGESVSRRNSVRMRSRCWRGARSCSRTRLVTCLPVPWAASVHDDTRFLNRWELSLEGRSLSLLKSRAVDYYSAAFYLTNPELERLRPNTIAVRRFRFVGQRPARATRRRQRRPGGGAVRAEADVRDGLRGTCSR